MPRKLEPIEAGENTLFEGAPRYASSEALLLEERNRKARNAARNLILKADLNTDGLLTTVVRVDADVWDAFVKAHQK